MFNAKTYAWHSKNEKDILAELQVDAAKGLTLPEVQKRISVFGRNELPENAPKPLFLIFLRQFKSPLIYLLFLAAIGASLLGELRDALVIFIIVSINSVIGAFQEGKAERSLSSLVRLSKVTARVLRSGAESIISSAELVPGDIVLLGAGDAVPADARIISTFSLECNEAPLTGESTSVLKLNTLMPENSIISDRKNMVYSGTFITSGRASAVVVSTGLNTEIGKIATLTNTLKPSATPLEKRVKNFSHNLILSAVVLFSAIVIIGWLRHIPLPEIIMIAISQVVSMVPEGLPVAMTVALAVGVQKMAAKHTIIRKLSAVETLGSITVICSDKTGTLTRGEMTVTEFFLSDNRKISVEGIGYSTQGNFFENAAQIFPNLVDNTDHLGLLLRISALCNDAQLSKDSSVNKAVGDPTEAALLVAAEKAGFSKAVLQNQFPRTAEIPFDLKTKIMVTEHRTQIEAKDETKFLALKGAPESLLPFCSHYLSKGQLLPLTQAQLHKISSNMHKMAQQALRVLAVAYIPNCHIKSDDLSELKNKGIFLGLIGQIDPARPEVKSAIHECHRAGIRPIMITGDHKATGLAVARTIGLATEGDLAADGIELESFSAVDFKNKFDKISVFARVHPSQKLQIVKALQMQNQIVAMTGDGVNDAPALRQADVGVAMGISGTAVAKEAAKIIITDDNFATILTAISEGRLVYQNIKKVILLLFSTSLAEIFILFTALLAGFPPPFAAVQILWNNLVTEGVITLNLILDPKDGNEMLRPPISPSEPLVTRLMLTRMYFMVPTMTALTLGWFMFRLKFGIPFEVARTETFIMIAACEWFNVLNCRSETKTALSLDIFRNKWLVGGLTLGILLQMLVVLWRPLGDIFRTVPIDLTLIPVIMLAASPMLLVEEIRKFFVRKKTGPL